MYVHKRTFSELLEAVVSGDLDLEHAVGYDEGGQAREALPATAPHPNQEHVAPQLSDHSYDAAH